MHTPPPRAMSVTDWLEAGPDAIDAAIADVERISANGSPIVQDELTEAVRLCKQLAALRERRRRG